MSRVDDDADMTMDPASRFPRQAEPSRLVPGSIIAGRYRLIALLGRGGMGEVYRAEDLTLDQQVALKFLPEAVVGDAARLAQFHNELRTARQVAHKNVVRLYDLGEVAGRPFLTMEYVDGEDLASLLRRIGRIPHDKAIDIARQLCAGVAAAHERGVLHRDLKPANVMLDGDGNVRITDFGIATAAADSAADLAGTPHYMAPELLAGATASPASDIYALGLILFEVFTGRRALEAKTVGQLKQLHDTNSVVTPSSIVKDIDPAVERAILRALDRDPLRRTASALAIAASLPGANPLAEALAAGETPSPELLAAAGEASPITLARAAAAMGVAVACITAFLALAPRTELAAFDALEKPPDVLVDRAQQIFDALGLANNANDHAYNFDFLGAYISWIQRTDSSSHRWDQMRASRPGPIGFWYRTSPGVLVPQNHVNGVTYSDPAETGAGMRSVALDTRGRLRTFHSVPPQLDRSQPTNAMPNWKPLFDAAGLDIGTFRPAAPEWTPPSYADVRAAWTGAYPERPDVPIRIEAAAYRGQPTWFYTVGPWTVPLRDAARSRSVFQSALDALNISVFVVGLVVAATLARGNVRRKRADTRAATRLALYLVAADAIRFVALNHHAGNVTFDSTQLFTNVGYGLYRGATLWVMYLAIEPYARRLWPDGLLGWTRMLAGHVRDARVGSDVLIGVALGSVVALLEGVRIVGVSAMGQPPPIPALGDQVKMLLGSGALVGQLAYWTYGPLETALFIGLAFVGLRFLLRNDWLAAAATIVVLLFLADNGASISAGSKWYTAFSLLLFVSVLLALLRYGLLVVVVGLVVGQVLTSVPYPARLSTWAAGPFRWALVLVAALMAYGAYAARATSASSAP